MRAPGRIRKSTRMHMKSPKIPRFFGLHPVFEHARSSPVRHCPATGDAAGRTAAGHDPNATRTASHPLSGNADQPRHQSLPAMQTSPDIKNSPRATGQRPDQYFPRHHAAMRSAMRASVEFEVFGS